MTNEETWQREYEAILNDPSSDCPACGAQLMQMHREGCIERRMAELVGFLVIRANKNRGEAEYYKAQQRTDTASYFDGLCRAYLDVINEIGCRLSPQAEVYFDGKEYAIRFR